MRYDFVYENNNGEKINLSKLPYKINIEPLIDYSWAYKTKQRQLGNKIVGFFKDIKDSTATLHVLAATATERDEAIDYFNNVIEKDIYYGTAGKLWLGDWYTYAFITASKNSKWQYDAGIVKKEITISKEADSWYHITRAANYGEQEDSTKYIKEDFIKTYDGTDMGDRNRPAYDYAYDYMFDAQSQKIIANAGSIPCDFIITIQGYADSPIITIGDNTYAVNVEVPYGANLVIDSTQKTVIITLADGTKINAFGARDPDYYLFERIDSGKNAVTWDGSYLWELLMIEERSEPRWLTD